MEIQTHLYNWWTAKGTMCSGSCANHNTTHTVVEYDLKHAKASLESLLECKLHDLYRDKFTGL